ncbi:MAG: phosphotransferase [Nanoarchaeota archaeon]
MVDTRRNYFSELGNAGLVGFVRDNFVPGLEGKTVVKLSDRDPEAEFFWSDIFIIDETYLVKEILSPVMNENLAYVDAKGLVLEHMASSGVPVIIPVKGLNGKPYAQVQAVSSDDPHLVEVAPYLASAERFSETVPQIADLGDAVGRITRAFLSLPQDVSDVISARKSIFQGYDSPESRTFDEELDFYDREQDKIPGWLGDEVRATLPAVRREYERIKASPTFPVPEYDIPKGLVHGDIHHFNTMFDKDTKTLLKVIDWDSMAESVRVRDLALSMERFAITLPDRKVSHVDRAEIFYQSFSKHYQCSPEEEAHMFDALVDYYMPNSCGILRDIFFKDFKHPNYPIYLAVLNPQRIRNLEKDLFGK